MASKDTPKAMRASYIKDLLEWEKLDSAYCLEALDQFLKAGRMSRDQLEKLFTFVFGIIEATAGKSPLQGNNPDHHVAPPITSSPFADHTTPKPETSDAGPV